MSAAPPYLDGERLVSLLTPQAALGAIQGFFASHGRAGVNVPPRIHLPVPGQSTVGLYMPAATSEFVGVKIVHLMPKRRPAVVAEILLYDAETGALLFWGDGKPLTALRTAGVSVAAGLKLHPAGEALLVFGAGVQAAAHIAAFAAAYPGLRQISAATRSPESFARLQSALSPELAHSVTRCDGADADVARADIVVTTTPSEVPLFRAEALRDDAHVVAIGSATPAMHEVPAGAFLDSQVWVDTPQALHEAGDCLRAVEAGWPAAALAGDLFDLLGGATVQAAPRTLFKSVGHAAQDLAILIALWRILCAQA